MAVVLVELLISAERPIELAGFWARALGWELGEATEDRVEVLPTDTTTFRLAFRRGARPKTGQNPIHFDLTSSSVEDQQRQVAARLADGAAPANVGQVGDEGHVVLADPEGNELCIIEPGNRFLASCPRLGAVNGDGTRALGHFFSAVLGWPLVWDEQEETAIQAPTGTGPKLTWSGPPLLPKSSHERIHLHLAPAAGEPVESAIEHLLERGATLVDDGDDGCPDAVTLADVDGNRLCLVPPR